ncbi:MAG: TIGR01459 family HAD-type hydrolase [Hyphomicrobiaceae bacterium]
MSDTSSAGSPVPIIESIAALAPTADAWLVDIWGVMHNGVAPYEEAVEACRRYRAAGGTVALLSNAPRPAAAALEQLRRIGVDEAAFDAIVTSGDLTRGLVEAWRQKRIHHLGPDRDLGIFAGLGIQFAPSSDADIVVCTGFLDDSTETVADYRTTLEGFRRRGALMICANPDLMVERGERIVPCAGALAAAYAELGGEVVYAGKPHPPVYELALATIADARGAPVAKARVLAIGDGVRTDIAGAAAVGLRSVFVASAIHVEKGDLAPDVVTRLFSGLSRPPVAAMTGLRW